MSKSEALKSFKSSTLKVYGIVYSVVALPMLYYGVFFMESIKSNFLFFIPSTLGVMSLSLIASFTMKRKKYNHVYSYLKDHDLNEKQKDSIKKDIYNYPLYMVLIMISGWFILMNLCVFLPIHFFMSGSLSELLIANMLILSGAAISGVITYLIVEVSVLKFLNLTETKDLKEPENVVRIPLSLKMLMVNMVIIIALLLNVLAAILLSSIYKLQFNQTIINIFILGIEGILASVLISILYAKSMKETISNIKNASITIKSGDLSANIHRLSNDELGDTAESFHQFVDSLAEIVRGIKSNVHDTIDSVLKLQNAMNTNSDSVKEINSITTSVESHISMQSEATSKVMNAINQILEIISKQDLNIENQAASVIESSSAINQMIAGIKSIAVNLQSNSEQFQVLNDATLQGNKNITGLKETVLNLNQQSDLVLNANKTIKSIAASTNLLALNAAIEAAHAGDAGRGFAVVADEIRALAEESTKQSKMINESLSMLKSAIIQAVSMTNETRESFDTIQNAVFNVTNLELEIKNAIQEQSSGSTQIMESLSAMNDITSEVSDGSKSMTRLSELVSEEINKLVEISEGVKQSAISVVQKAVNVNENTEKSILLLDSNMKSTYKIDESIAIFKNV